MTNFGLSVFDVAALPTVCPWPSVDLSRSKLTPYRHQASGVGFVCFHPYSMNASEMGTGKSYIAINAACHLYVQGIINRVIVVAPSGLRQVWSHPELGEIKKHSWDNLPIRVTEYHEKVKQWSQCCTDDTKLNWVVTNYEWLILRYDRQGNVTESSQERFRALAAVCGPKTLLVLDESSAIANPSAEQTKAVVKLRKVCGRVHLMNGTPVSEGAGGLFSQGNVMSPTILDCPSKTQYKARYAIEEDVRGPGGKALEIHGRVVKRVRKWTNLGNLERRFAPYVIRHMKADCLDLPEKLPTVPLFVPLKKSWPSYVEMRDDAMTWLSGAEASMSPQITTKIMRLSQITSGFLGGVQENDIAEREQLVEENGVIGYDFDDKTLEKYEREVGSEKLDFFIQWLDDRIAEDKHFKLLVWSKHRFEILRTFNALTQLGLTAGMIIGGQKPADREASVKLLDLRTAPDGPAIVIGHPKAGGKGFTLTAAHTVMYLSNGYSLEARLQSEDRAHRAGQRNIVSYFDLIATGPKGQKTIDMAIMQALQAKDDLSTAMTSKWVSMLREEE